MKKLFLILSATLLVACADNGTSAPSEICYDKQITYADMKNPMYKQYQDQWFDNACADTIMFNDGSTQCAKYNQDYMFTVRECMENVEFN